MREQKREEHFIAGMTGAFLGSFVGAACIVLVGHRSLWVFSFCFYPEIVLRPHFPFVRTPSRLPISVKNTTGLILLQPVVFPLTYL